MVSSPISSATPPRALARRSRRSAQTWAIAACTSAGRPAQIVVAREAMAVLRSRQATLLAHPTDEGPKAARREDQLWHGRASAAGVLGPGFEDPLLAPVRQLNLEVGLAPGHDPLPRPHHMPAVAVPSIDD